jgi:DNA helicase-2/ATP-dependent DNA helicase PcrA
MGNGNLAVIATAGSGKTTVLTKRIECMVAKQGVNPSSILAVTFNRNAKEHIDVILKGLGIHNVNIETFHSLALKIIIAAYGNKFKIWTEQWVKEKIIQKVCTYYGLCSSEHVPYNSIFTFISLQKANMLKPSDELICPKSMPFNKGMMQRVYEKYESLKEEEGYIEFDDFFIMANDILDNDKKILSFYRNKFKYVLSDEFQDVSMPQALLLRKLNNTNTMIVGDPLQAIYSFRGGDSGYIMNFDSVYKDTKVINLNTNYRCSKEIVETANALASKIPDSQHKNYVESVAYNEGFKKPELYHYRDEYVECDRIAGKIIELTKNYDYNGIAVLARTNAQLQKLESALHSKNIPFNVVNGVPYSESPEIKLVLSYLRLAFDKNDNDAFRYLYNKPHRWLDKKFLEEVEENADRKKKNKSLYCAMETIGRRNWKFKNGIDEISRIINHLQCAKYKDVAELVSYLRQELNIDEFVSKGKVSDDGSSCEQIENLDSFQNMCKKYRTIEKLLLDMNDFAKTSTTSDGGKVNLSTIHKAKGLEFPVVFIMGCNNGLLPHLRNENTDDERRLLYVAITRAEKELYLSYTDSYNGKISELSPFLYDILQTVDVKKTQRKK